MIVFAPNLHSKFVLLVRANEKKSYDVGCEEILSHPKLDNHSLD
jgi:hypothetical protein